MKIVKLFYAGLFILIFSTLGFADTIHVPTDYLTIQAAVDASNWGDTIIVADGVYTEDGNINILLNNKDITIKSENGPENCILDGAGKIGAKCFMIPDSLSKKIIDGFTIQNFHTGISGRGRLYIKNNIIKNCYYEAINCGGWNHNIINNVLINNGISELTEISEIKYNTYNQPYQCFQKGYAYSGAAIAIFNSWGTIQNNFICNNIGSLAGGIYCDENSTGEILNNTILNNKTYFGGGITINNPAISVMNNIIKNSYNNSGVDRLERWFQKSLFWQINYEGTKRSSVTYYLGFKNNGEAGDARVYGPGLNTTLTIQSGEYYLMEITSFVETNGFYGGLDLTVQLGLDTLSFVNIINIEPYGSLYGGCILLSNPTFQSFGTNNKDFFATGAGIIAIADEAFQNIKYNDFYNNVGGNYILKQSSNDTIITEISLPDTAGNISEDPKLSNTYSLMDGSPCIDAGNPDVLYDDASLPPGLGTVRNDMGISGGPWGFEIINITAEITANSNPIEGGSTTGAGSYAYSQTATLTATPSSGYDFVNWMVDGIEVSNDLTYSFNITEDKVLVANFQIQSFEVTVSVNPIDGGTISGVGSYYFGEIITLKAINNSSYEFISWTENGSSLSTDSVYIFTINEDRELVANFEKLSTSLSDLVVNDAIKAYPNPTKGQLFINSGNTYTNVQIDILTMTGQVIETRRMNGENQLNIEIIGSSGLYFLKIFTEEGQLKIFKIIKY